MEAVDVLLGILLLGVAAAFCLGVQFGYGIGRAQGHREMRGES